LILRISKNIDLMFRDILISHPAIYQEIPLIGRPGIRLPYMRYFALHYQIWEDKTVITMMPGILWMIPNNEFVANLEKNIRKLIDIVN
jgi:hypothetical protein